MYTQNENGVHLMSDKKRISKRLQITISPESHKILSDYKSETGESASKLIDQIIKDSTPMLKALINAHKAIKDGKLEGVKHIKETLYRASEELSQIAIDFDTKTSKKTSTK